MVALFSALVVQRLDQLEEEDTDDDTSFIFPSQSSQLKNECVLALWVA